MGKVSKIELRVREEIVRKQNLLTSLEFDVETYKDRVIATKAELVTLNGLLVTDGETAGGEE